jgi:hypothetical protein
MKFYSGLERYIPKNYPKTDELYNFYLQLHLLDAINYPHEYGDQFVNKLISANISYQPQSKIV